MNHSNEEQWRMSHSKEDYYARKAIIALCTLLQGANKNDIELVNKLAKFKDEAIAEFKQTIHLSDYFKQHMQHVDLKMARDAVLEQWDDGRCEVRISIHDDPIEYCLSYYGDEKKLAKSDCMAIRNYIQFKG